jgi:hypothetical protein
MKRYSTLFVLWLGIAACAMGSTGGAQHGFTFSPDPASSFVGGCGLILVTMGRLAWKIRKTEK